MTTKVVKGSLWTLAGQVAPFAVTFFSTPIVIRLLGTEGYGVLLLIGLIPMYFSFADFGMNIASTKFASEAYGEGDREKEGAVIRAAGIVALVASSLVAIPIFIFSRDLAVQFNVPEHLHSAANIALKIAACGLVVTVLASAVNAPILARLRMDLNVITSAGPKILLAAVTPVILYLNGGIVGALAWTLVVGLATLAIILAFSGRLLPELFRPTIRRELFPPLLKFGGSWFVAMIAAMLLINLEKLLLTKLVSVQALAFYSVAFTFANLATTFSQAITPSLIPAFSQLLGPDKSEHFNTLFARSMRVNLIWLLPAVMLMFVIAQPFFAIWFGEEFGTNSTLPFYVLLVGLFFNLQATVPYVSIMSVGRTDIFARLYWIELAIYAVAAFALINAFGIVGAALAWTLRASFDSIIIIHFSRKYAGVSFKHLANLRNFLLAAATLVPAIVATAVYGTTLIALVLAPLGLILYAIVIWRAVVDADEKRWLTDRYRKFFKQVPTG